MFEINMLKKKKISSKLFEINLLRSEYTKLLYVYKIVIRSSWKYCWCDCWHFCVELWIVRTINCQETPRANRAKKALSIDSSLSLFLPLILFSYFCSLPQNHSPFYCGLADNTSYNNVKIKSQIYPRILFFFAKFSILFHFLNFTITYI